MSQIKRLQTIDADTLQSTAYEPVSFVVDDLLPQGLHLLAGAPKIGKSWLALWLCLCAAQGKPLWTFATRPCEVLYLCLEDSFQRITAFLKTTPAKSPHGIPPAPRSLKVTAVSARKRSLRWPIKGGFAQETETVTLRERSPLFRFLSLNGEKRSAALKSCQI